MRPFYPLVGGALLAACLVGWVALAWGNRTRRIDAAAGWPGYGSGAGYGSGSGAGCDSSSGGPRRSWRSRQSLMPFLPRRVSAVYAAIGSTRHSPAPSVSPYMPPSAPLATPPMSLPMPNLTPQPPPAAPASLFRHRAGCAANSAPIKPEIAVPAPSVPPVFMKPETVVSPGPDNTMGRQEPAVSIEWVGPPMAKSELPLNTCS